MESPPVLSTVVNLAERDQSPKKSSWSVQETFVSRSVATRPSSSRFWPHRDHEDSSRSSEEPQDDAELKLPQFTSLVMIILGNAILQVSLFIVVSAASVYTEYLGGTATFSGLVIGIPTIFSGLALFPMTRYDGGRYKAPLQFAYAALLLGSILYALAYPANYLYLIFIGRIVSGFGFTAALYTKRYCSDPRLVGVRRRTTLASWLVMGQGFGFSVGPFLGGALYKIGFSNKVFNGFTSPGWVMAGMWALLGIASIYLFKDVKPQTQRAVEFSTELSPIPATSSSNHGQTLMDIDDETNAEGLRRPSFHQWGVIIAMCWYGMTCFFILGAWEANIPIFAAAHFGYSPYASGNFIAFGGLATFPFLLLNVVYARRFQDRSILSIGSALGTSGLIIMLAILRAEMVTFGSFLVCWFLVALGFNLASTCTLSLLSKQLPPSWNGKISMGIQYSNYLGRALGAVWGGAGVNIGMVNYVGLQIGIVGIAGLMHLTLWRQLKAKTG